MTNVSEYAYDILCVVEKGRVEQRYLSPSKQVGLCPKRKPPAKLVKLPDGQQCSCQKEQRWCQLAPAGTIRSPSVAGLTNDGWTILVFLSFSEIQM